ncbi:MAG: ABC transporter substrate-binding protein, partial [Pseudomonadota bacterium]
MRNWFHRWSLNGGIARALAIATVAGLAMQADTKAWAQAQQPGTESKKPAPVPLEVAVHVSSDANRCFAPGLVAAIKHFTAQRVAEANATGGIHGRPLTLKVYDDFEDAAKTIDNVRNAIGKPDLLAMIGIPSSTRGRRVFNALGEPIRKSNVPFISEMSLDEIFSSSPNVFTMASSVRDELDVIRARLAEGNYERPVFVGLDDDDYSFALERGLSGTNDPTGKLTAMRLPVRGYRLGAKDSITAAKRIAALNPDIVITSIHSGHTATLLARLDQLGISAPVLILLGRISSVTRVLARDTQRYRGALFQIAREGVPNVYSERLRGRIWQRPNARWIFEDIANTDAPGWTDGSCRANASGPARSWFDPANQRAIGRGTQYSDMLSLIITTARDAPPDLTVQELRDHISSKLRSFTEGRQVLKGLWQDWAFTSSRAAAVDTLLLVKQPREQRAALAPTQFQRSGGTLRPTRTVYMSIDLIRLAQIDTNDQQFDADFYLTVRSKGKEIGLADIEFTNAVRAPTGEGKLISVQVLDTGQGVKGAPRDVVLFRVSGRFHFQPELSHYPFDRQKFSISFQPSSTARPFLIQPTFRENWTAGQTFIDGWRLQDHYVGADQDIIPTLGETLSERRIVSFYKFNATWIAERIAIDYYTRVIIPLGFILMVTYFSAFLPQRRFD